jgi:hypothetical protein
MQENSKFVVGDSVKIIHTDNDTELFLGRVGTLHVINRENQPNYGVKFSPEDWTIYFYEIELEKV